MLILGFPDAAGEWIFCPSVGPSMISIHDFPFLYIQLSNIHLQETRSYPQTPDKRPIPPPLDFCPTDKPCHQSKV